MPRCLLDRRDPRLEGELVEYGFFPPMVFYVFPFEKLQFVPGTVRIEGCGRNPRIADSAPLPCGMTGCLDSPSDVRLFCCPAF